MLNFIALLACVFGPTSLVAILAWWLNPRLRWTSIVVLASGAGIVVFLPIRTVFYTPSSLGFDGFGGGGLDGMAIFAEFLLLGGFLGLVHLGALFVIIMLGIEKLIERWKAMRKPEKAQSSFK
jgi:hypothetical protein